jgi:hypothetical protein
MLWPIYPPAALPLLQPHSVRSACRRLWALLLHVRISDGMPCRAVPCRAVLAAAGGRTETPRWSNPNVVSRPAWYPARHGFVVSQRIFDRNFRSYWPFGTKGASAARSDHGEFGRERADVRGVKCSR